MTLQAIYISAAAQSFSQEELAELLEKSRKANAAKGISGMLVYHQGSFLQILEGPAHVVEDLLKTIAGDPRHKNMRVLFKDLVEDAEYEDWSMGYVDPTGAARILEGFIGYGGRLNALVSDGTRAKKVVQRFKDGLWRQAKAA